MVLAIILACSFVVLEPGFKISDTFIRFNPTVYSFHSYYGRLQLSILYISKLDRPANHKTNILITDFGR